MFASLLHFYPGLTERDLLKMPIRRFYMYYDYMIYIQRWGGDEASVKLNKMLNETDKRKYPYKGNNNNNNNLLSELSKSFKIRKDG